MRSYAAFEECRSLANSVEYRPCVSTEDIVDKVLLCGGVIDATGAVEKYTESCPFFAD